MVSGGAAANVEVVIDEKKLLKAVSEADGVQGILSEKTAGIASRANSLGAGFRTGKWHDPATGESKGMTQPVYEGDVRRGKRGYVGIVHPGNYAAMKDNYENNTLLKAKG